MTEIRSFRQLVDRKDMGETHREPSQVQGGSYIAELDGVRAISIIVVLLFHLHLPGCSLGWIGVWLFFVVSGFLITGILFDSRQEAFYFRNFYLRRTLRIFPVYYLVFLAVVALCVWWGRSGDWPWYALYLQNYRLPMPQRLEFLPVFHHTWSLAVEEQFYLLWPLLVWMLSRRAFVVLAGSMLLLAPACRWWTIHNTTMPHMAYMALPCVWDSLAMGGLLAALTRSEYWRQPVLMRKWLMGLGGLGLAGMTAMVVSTGLEAYWEPEAYLRPGSPNFLLYSAMSLFFVCGLGYILTVRGGWATRLLANAPARHIGRISYGIYLYHWPVFWGVDRMLDSAGISYIGSPRLEALLAVVKLLATYGLSVLSWVCIERRFLGLKDLLARRRPAEAVTPIAGAKATGL